MPRPHSKGLPRLGAKNKKSLKVLHRTFKDCTQLHLILSLLGEIPRSPGPFEVEAPDRSTGRGPPPKPWSGALEAALPVQAGFLTHGSFYSPSLPGALRGQPVVMMDFVPVHSGGTATDFHRLPS